MTQEIYNYLKCNNRSSFAIWKEKDACDPKNVCDLSAFSDFSEVADRLKPNIIFVGMNLASDAKTIIRPFANFHSSVQRHNDFRLRDAIVGTPFEGAYMTDMFKLVTSSSSDLAKHYRNNPMERDAAILEFVEECRSVCKNKKYLICVGQGYHYEVICKYFSVFNDFVCRFSCPDDIKKPCFYIPHYSGAAGKTDAKYHEEAVALLKKIQKDIEQ